VMHMGVLPYRHRTPTVQPRLLPGYGVGGVSKLDRFRFPGKAGVCWWRSGWPSFNLLMATAPGRGTIAATHKPLTRARPSPHLMAGETMAANSAVAGRACK